MSTTRKVISSVLGTAFAGAALTSMTAQADGNPFAATDLSQGYDIAGKDMEGKCGEGKCGGGDKSSSEGKCGEGKCGG